MVRSGATACAVLAATDAPSAATAALAAPAAIDPAAALAAAGTPRLGARLQPAALPTESSEISRKRLRLRPT